jgi:hypothetical protein
MGTQDNKVINSFAISLVGVMRRAYANSSGFSPGASTSRRAGLPIDRIATGSDTINILNG